MFECRVDCLVNSFSLLPEYSCYSDIETKLLQDLLNNYTALGRPVVSNNDAVHVTFDLKLHKIEKLVRICLFFVNLF